MKPKMLVAVLNQSAHHDYGHGIVIVIDCLAVLRIMR